MSNAVDIDDPESISTPTETHEQNGGDKVTHYYPGTIAVVVAFAYAVTFQFLTTPSANFAPHILPMVGIATLAALTWMYLPLPRDATTETCWGFHPVEGIRRESE